VADADGGIAAGEVGLIEQLCFHKSSQPLSAVMRYCMLLAIKFDEISIIKTLIRDLAI